MLSIAVCDDDVIYVDMIESSINVNFKDVMIEKFVSSKELLLSNEIYDIIFLDIDMPEVSGFNIAEEIRKKNSYTKIIFVSGKDSMVVQSIHYAPFRFVRKQYFDMEIREAVLALQAQLEREDGIIDVLVSGESIRIPIMSIMYVEALAHKCIFYLYEREISSIETFEKVCKKLAVHGFIHIHRSYMVNFKAIKLFGKNCVILNNNVELPVSKYKKKQVLRDYQVNLLNEKM